MLEDILKGRKGGRQQTIDGICKKELRTKTCMEIGRWFYDAGIPFHAATYDSFRIMLEVVAQYGPGFQAPTMHEVRVPLLTKEVEDTKTEMGNHKNEWRYMLGIFKKAFVLDTMCSLGIDESNEWLMGLMDDDEIEGKGVSSSLTPKVPPPRRTQSKRLHQLINEDDEYDEEMEEDFGVSENDEEDVVLGIDVDDDD
ncbi:hypothetical protein E3N88_13692 [Mikania micrantha]|uniref:Uncharacterized protein n=1 Tax=Mikania micrantha TaxID=192012 RepID=A0A5N6NZN5_9ASTR|nr:hypothetical protein E3N88_13692 [Mikania micrantha]